ncbi:hypothetical protein N2152v2_005830 [Parachlorella kessleri]
MNFRESTQRRRWLFTPEKLAAADASAADVDSETSAGSRLALSQFPAVHEELQLVKFCEAQVQSMCQEIPLPRKVLGTALQYLKRFYLSHSTLDHDPQYMAVTCMYLACKIEDCYRSAAELEKRTNAHQDILLKYELLLLEGLNFDFIVFTPYRAIEGLLEDIAACRRAAGVNGMTGSSTSRAPGGYPVDPSSVDEGLLPLTDEQMAKARTYAYLAADALMLTDAPLLYTPGQLALAACRSGFSKVGVRLRKVVDRVARQAAAGSNGDSSSEDDMQQQTQQLQQVLAALDVLGAEGSKKVEKEQFDEIYARLKACRSLNAGAAKKAAAEKAKARAEKQQRKAEKLREMKQQQEAALGLVPVQQALPGQQEQDGATTGAQPPAKRARPSEPF